MPRFASKNPSILVSGEQTHTARALTRIWLGSEREPEPGADLIARMFILILGTVLALAHVYVWKRLVKDTTRPGRGRIVLTAAMSGAAALLAVTLFGSRFTDV